MEQKKFNFKNILKSEISLPGSGNADKQVLFENLAEMLSSGIDIIVALESIKEEARSKKLQKLCEELKFDIENGSSIWVALEKRKLLDPHLLTLVKIGEQSGNLARNLKVVIEQQKKDRAFKSSLRSASLYPVFVFVLMIIVGLVVALFILPRLSSVYKSLSSDLPLITQIMINIGDFFQNYGIIAVPVILIVIGLIIYFLFFFEKTKIYGQKLMLNSPIVKTFILEIEMGRMGYLIGTLLQSGFSAPEAFKLLASSSTYYIYKQFYEYIAEFVSQGWTFKQVFGSIKKIDKLIPLYPRQLIITGEKTGKLAESFLKVSEIYERKNDETVKNLGTLLEPILLLIVWVGVASIALAVILPIYSLIGNLTTISSEGV
jgi:type IV pilus assembly protein PilC